MNSLNSRNKRRQRFVSWSKHREDERHAELRPIEEHAAAARDASRAALAERSRCELALHTALQSRATTKELIRLIDGLARAERSEVQAARIRVAWEAKLGVAQQRVELARRDRRALENWSERLSASEVARAAKREDIELSELARRARFHHTRRTLEQRAHLNTYPQARIGA